MPVEIRELHIKLNLKPDQTPQSASAADGNESVAADQTELMAEVEDLVQQAFSQQKER